MRPEVCRLDGDLTAPTPANSEDTSVTGLSSERLHSRPSALNTSVLAPITALPNWKTLIGNIFPVYHYAYTVCLFLYFILFIFENRQRDDLLKDEVNECILYNSVHNAV